MSIPLIDKINNYLHISFNNNFPNLIYIKILNDVYPFTGQTSGMGTYQV